MRLRGLSAGAVAVLAIALGFSCTGESQPAEPDTLCSPGENIFCRCPGGDAGTKRCNDDGQSFAECDFCQSRGGDGSSDVGQGPGPSVGPGAGAGGSTGGLDLLRPCVAPEECQSGICESGYCTIACDQVSDCEYPVAECVPWVGGAVCMPTCTSASDCEVYGAPPSLCGFAPAVDNWTVTVCASWDSDHELLPPGTECPPLDHEACNLGYARGEIVCTPEGVCTNGCFKEGDCPDGKNCSSTGSEIGDCR